MPDTPEEEFDYRDFDGDPVPESPEPLEERPEPEGESQMDVEAARYRGWALIRYAVFMRGRGPAAAMQGGSGTGIAFGGLLASLIAVPLSLFFVLVGVGMFRTGQSAAYAPAVFVLAIALFLLYMFGKNGIESAILIVRGIKQVVDDKRSVTD